MKRTLLAWLLLLLAAGCTGVSNLRLNEELTNLYAARVEARAGDDVIMAETTTAALRSLAARARAEAEAATDPADAVSFYRIAATAAWQGESPDVAAISDSGWSICERDDFDAARRDCVMLLVIPDLAATDALTARLDEQNRQVREARERPAGDTRDAELETIGETADDMFASLETRFDVLAGATERFPPATVPPALVAQLEHNRDFIYCRLRDTLGLLTRSVGMSDPRFQRRQQQLESIRRSHDPDDRINCAP